MIAKKRTCIPNRDLALLASVYRGETEYTVIAAHLRELPLSQQEAAISFNGELRNFSRHANGGGWIEAGNLVPEHVHVYDDAVILRGFKLDCGVVSVQGGEIANYLSYDHYE